MPFLCKCNGIRFRHRKFCILKSAIKVCKFFENLHFLKFLLKKLSSSQDDIEIFGYEIHFVLLWLSLIPILRYNLGLMRGAVAYAGGIGGSNPRPGKNGRKMRLFPKALFLATPFPKIDKNSFFLLNFHQNFQNFLKNSQLVVFFVQTRKNLTPSFEMF